MGGAKAGEVAAQIAVEEVGRLEGPVEVGDIRAAVERANRAIRRMARDDPDKSGMGTTFTAAMLEDGRLDVVHVGDSRAYLWRDGRLRQLTEDHSVVAELVERGSITPRGRRDPPPPQRDHPRPRRRAARWWWTPSREYLARRRRRAALQRRPLVVRARGGHRGRARATPSRWTTRPRRLVERANARRRHRQRDRRPRARRRGGRRRERLDGRGPGDRRARRRAGAELHGRAEGARRGPRRGRPARRRDPPPARAAAGLAAAPRALEADRGRRGRGGRARGRGDRLDRQPHLLRRGGRRRATSRSRTGCPGTSSA